MVSVVMPVKNCEQYVAAAIESILSQSYSNLELIVVDDGSTDNTNKIVRDYLVQDGRLRLYDGKSVGLVRALNLGCSLARGKWIARMDADDIAEHARIAIQVKYLTDHPEVRLLGSAVSVISSNGQKVAVLCPERTHNEILRRLESHHVFWHNTVVFSSELYHSIGGYRSVFVGAEDHDLWCRFAEHCVVANLVDPLVQYRLHLGQSSQQCVEQQIRAVLAVCATTRIRRLSGVDPAVGVMEMDDEFLATLKIESSAIKSAIFSAYLHWASMLRKCKDYEGGLEQLRRAAGSLPADMDGALPIFKLYRSMSWAALRDRKIKSSINAAINGVRIIAMRRFNVARIKESVFLRR